MISLIRGWTNQLQWQDSIPQYSITLKVQLSRWYFACSWYFFFFQLDSAKRYWGHYNHTFIIFTSRASFIFFPFSEAIFSPSTVLTLAVQTDIHNTHFCTITMFLLAKLVPITPSSLCYSNEKVMLKYPTQISNQDVKQKY